MAIEFSARYFKQSQSASFMQVSASGSLEGNETANSFEPETPSDTGEGRSTGNDPIQDRLRQIMSDFEAAKRIISQLQALKDKGDGDNTVRGTAGRDTFDLGDFAEIFAGHGDDTIDVHNHAVVHAGSGDDTVDTYAYARVFGGSGNDTINTYSHAQVHGGSGDDTISTYGFSQVHGGSGDDDIRTYGHSNVIGGSGDDYISTNANSKVRGGSGDDQIETYSHSIVDGGSGNDRISTYGHSNIKGGDGDDDIDGYDHLVVDAGDGDDTVRTYDFATVDGGNGNDEIRTGDNSVISGGSGNDVIRTGAGSRVDAGIGNDTIHVSGPNSTIVFNKGDGSDTIQASDDVNIDLSRFSKDEVSIQQDGNQVKVTFSGSEDSLTIDLASGSKAAFTFADGNRSVSRSESSQNYGTAFGAHAGTSADSFVELDLGMRIDAQTDRYSKVSSFSINGGDGDDSILVYANALIKTAPPEQPANKDVTITASNSQLGNQMLVQERTVMGGDGDDRISVWAKNAYVNGGDGDDNLFALANSRLVGGSGDDVISTQSGSYADGGSGDDVLIASTGAIVSGGTGNDTILAAPGSIVEYNAGDGSDTINMGLSDLFGIDPNQRATIQLGEGLTAEDTDISVDGNVATVTFKEQEGQLTINFKSFGNANLRFANGDVVTVKPL